MGVMRERMVACSHPQDRADPWYRRRGPRGPPPVTAGAPVRALDELRGDRPGARRSRLPPV